MSSEESTSFVLVRIDWDDQYNDLIGIYDTHEKAFNKAVDCFLENNDDIKDREELLSIIEKSPVRGDWALEKGIQWGCTFYAIYEY